MRSWNNNYSSDWNNFSLSLFSGGSINNYSGNSYYNSDISEINDSFDITDNSESVYQNKLKIFYLKLITKTQIAILE